MANDSEPERSWEWREIGAAAGAVALLIWLLATFGSDGMSRALSNGGQAVGFVAGGVAVYAMLVALRQLELQREALKEQAAAAMKDHELRTVEVLRGAYARWYTQVRDVEAEALRCVVSLKYPYTDDEREANVAFLAVVNRLITSMCELKLIDPSMERVERMSRIATTAAQAAERAYRKAHETRAERRTWKAKHEVDPEILRSHETELERLDEAVRQFLDDLRTELVLTVREQPTSDPRTN